MSAVVFFFFLHFLTIEAWSKKNDFGFIQGHLLESQIEEDV